MTSPRPGRDVLRSAAGIRRGTSGDALTHNIEQESLCRLKAVPMPDGGNGRPTELRERVPSPEACP